MITILLPCMGFMRQEFGEGLDVWFWLKVSVLAFSGCYNKKSKVKVLAELVSCEASVSGLQVADFWPCSHMAFPLCTCEE